MALSALAPDVIGGLTELLHVQELFRLLLTGNKLIQAKIRQQWRNLNLEFIWNPRRGGLSSSLRMLHYFTTNLQRLEITERYKSSLKIDRGDVDWTLLPSTLIELKIDFNAPALLPPELDLAKLLPNLHKLWIIALKEASWLSLPDSLSSITVASPKAQYSDIIFDALPASLRHLSIACPIKCKSHNALDLRHLTLETLSLQLQLKGPLSWRCFPSTLSHLSIQITKGEAPPPEDTSWAELFPTLTSLHLPPTSFIDTASDRFSPFPPSLTEIRVHHCELEDDVNLDPVFQPIRSQLKKLDNYAIRSAHILDFTNLESMKLQDLPPNVLAGSHLFTTSHRITTLEVEELSPTNLAHLPSTLTRLKFIQMSASDLNYNIWPQNLLYLHIASNFALNQLDFGLFPVSLHTLSLAASCYLRYLRKGSITHLTNLTHLKLCSYFKGGAFFREADELPPNLQVIECDSDYDQGAIMDVIFNEKPLAFAGTFIVDLQLGPLQRRLDILQAMPPTLRSISFYAIHSDIWSNDLILALPSQLVVLKAPGAKGWFKNTAKPLKNLPTTLRVLDVATRVKPNDFERSVPTFLARLDWSGEPFTANYISLCDERARLEALLVRSTSNEVSDGDSTSNESPRAASPISVASGSSASDSVEKEAATSSDESMLSIASTASIRRRASTNSVSSSNASSADSSEKSDEKPSKSAKPTIWERFFVTKGIKKKKSKKDLKTSK